MKVRIENLRIKAIEDRLEDRSINGLEDLTPEDRHLYNAVGEHGVAMAEYIYKLVGEDDQGWRDTAKSWIDIYRPYFLDTKIVCQHFHPDFVELIEDALETNREFFCEDNYSE